MNVVSWLGIIIVGVVLGVVVSLVLPEARQDPITGSAPHPVKEMLHAHLSPGMHGGPVSHSPPVASSSPHSPILYTPWILTLLGVGLAIGFRKDEKLLGLGVMIATAGVTALA